MEPMPSSSSSQQHRRMVVLAGPHKSASSSVQELFMKYASNDGRRSKHPSLQEWVWPWNPRRRSYLPRKGFAPLVTEDVGFHRLIWDTILQVWNATNPTTGLWEHPHLIWGTEELDRFGPVPWSHRNGLAALYQVWNITRPSSMDIVVHYRRPRKDQWISIWKQLERREQNSSYPTFLCDAQEYTRLWEYLDCVANPLGLIQAWLEYWQHHHPTATNITVHLLDMQGITQAQRDIGHVVACDVLGVECTPNHWLPNVQEQPILQNAKSGNPGLAQERLIELEWILRQRDCWYRARLEPWARTLSSSSAAGAPRLQFHYADTLWEHCPDNDKDGDRLTIFANTTFLLNVLQSQVGCGTLSERALYQLLHGYQNTTGLTKRAGKSLHLPYQPLSSPDPNLTLVQFQVAILYVLLVGMIGWFGVRRLKVTKYVPQRRLAGQRVG